MNCENTEAPVAEITTDSDSLQNAGSDSDASDQSDSSENEIVDTSEGCCFNTNEDLIEQIFGSDNSDLDDL